MTARIFLNGRVTLHHGDSRDVLKGMADASIDSVCTDPPYALVSIVKRFGKEGSAACKVPDGGTGAYARASAGFMGQAWDTGETAFAAQFWAEILRVLKPGGHVLAFSGTRTYHRLACAIEDAGLEIRDMTAWLYGSGFPKSHDVSKGIAKRRTEDEAPAKALGAWLREQREAHRLTQKEVAKHWPSATGGVTGCVANWELGLGTPLIEQWDKLKAVIGFGDEMDAEVIRLNRRKGERGERWTDAEVVGEIDCASPGFGEKRFDGDRSIRALDDEAAQWEGWGTALKPALEPIVLARKPLIGTVAANVLAHGAGALNIDGCRVPTDESTSRQSGVNNGIYGADDRANVRGGSDLGRWPANVIHDGSEEVLAAFPEQSSGGTPTHRNADKFRNTYGEFKGGEVESGIGGSSGNASRFFYTAKADSNDRVGSKHPTIKPVDLMRYLCRLVTPKQVWYCPQCDITEYEKNSPQVASDSPTVRRVRDSVSPEGQSAHGEILQPEVCLEGARSEADAVRVVRERVSAEIRRGEALLQQDLCEQAHSGAPGQPQTLSDNEEGLQAGVDASSSARERSEGLPVRAQVDSGAGDRAPASSVGSRPPQERGEDGQSAGEPGADEQRRPRQAESAEAEHAVLPSLPGNDRNQPACSHCGHRLATRPGRVLDPFAGTGTTGEAAFYEGFRAILIEREAEYVTDIERRMSLCLAGPEEKARAIIKARGKTEAPGPLFAEAAE